MALERWQPGEQLDVRTIWHGRVHSAHPAFVVEDTGAILVTYLAPGQIFKRPFQPNGGEARVPHGEWVFQDEVWRVPALRIFLKDEAHSMLAFLGEGAVQRWYVNLEDPPVRTSRGIDTRDHMVDVVFSSDLSEYRWKDLEELEDALALEVVDADEAAHIQAEGERVIEQLLRGQHPAVDPRWNTWAPPDSWGIPVLSSHWSHA
jgi:predicted RNA-binding protein associated with RNAse of E/G family